MKFIETGKSVIKAPIEGLHTLVNDGLYDSNRFDPDIFNEYGVFVLRDFLSFDYLKDFIDLYFNAIDDGFISKDSFHKTQVRIDKIPKFNEVAHCDEFIKLAKMIYDYSAAVDFYRIVKKDSNNYAAVFPHQDSCYSIGNFNSTSVFIALTASGPDNGGLKLYPGTKNFGHTGDAGTLNLQILPDGYPSISPHLNVGDALIMNSGTWHESPVSQTKDPRVYLEFQIRDGNDPAARDYIFGSDSRRWVINSSVDEIYIDSREQRLVRMYKENSELRKKYNI
ncbi:phytanoyl-CoA dioxygenase family protein [Alphaproteobacteria bacterium]|nr:phytanoyl-CoA dioxygenase family protein [Alphaproteobacteria bacterium]